MLFPLQLGLLLPFPRCALNCAPDPAAAQDGLHGADEVALLGEVPRVARQVRDFAARRRENPGMGSRERAQPTTFRIQISFLLLVTGLAIGLLVLVDNDYCTSLASPTASSGPELKSETAPNSKSGTLRYFSGRDPICRHADRPRLSPTFPAILSPFLHRGHKKRLAVGR